MRKVHRVPKGTNHDASKVMVFDPACTLKTRTRKIAVDALDLMTVIGVGRFELPKRNSIRYSNTL